MLSKKLLRPYQIELTNAIIKNKSYALFADMGAGKTVCTLTALELLMSDFKVKKPLIIAPKLIADTVWKQECANWNHLYYLTGTNITGNEEQRKKALKIKSDFYIINVENLVWLLNFLDADFDFDMIIIDESSKFKNYKSKRFKALKKTLPLIERRIILTGTPTPNGLEDIWSQIYILDEGTRLGRFITHYRDRYFKQKRNGFGYELRDFKTSDEIISKISDISKVLKLDDENIDLPDFINIYLNKELPIIALNFYKEMKNNAIIELKNAKVILKNTKDRVMRKEAKEIIAKTAGVVNMKLKQICSGALIDEEQNINIIHNLKFEMLKEIIENNPNDNILVAYSFRNELERAKDYFKQDIPTLTGVDNVLEIVEKWNNKKIPLLFAHPKSAGHGLNLQHGGSIIVWFGFTDSLEEYQQMNKRLHRSGQKQPVRCIHLSLGKVENDILKRLSNKEKVQDYILENLEQLEY